MAFEPAFQLGDDKKQTPEKPSDAAFGLGDQPEDKTQKEGFDLPEPYDEYEGLFNHLVGMGETAQETMQRGEKAKKALQYQQQKERNKIGFGETMKYLPGAVWETIGGAGVVRDIKEEGIKPVAEDAVKAAPGTVAAFGERIVTAPFKFSKGLIGLVDEEAAEKIIPSKVPHPTRLLFEAIGKEEWVGEAPVDIGPSYTERHKRNIREGMNPWFSALTVGTDVIWDGVITAQIAQGLLEGAAKKPPKEKLSTKQARQRLGVKRGASKEAIKKAYYKKSHQVHPDKPGGSVELMKGVNRAYESLTGTRPTVTRFQEIAHELTRNRSFWGKAAKQSAAPTPSGEEVGQKLIEAPTEGRAIAPKFPTPNIPPTPVAEFKKPSVDVKAPKTKRAAKPIEVPKELKEINIPESKIRPKVKSNIPDDLEPLAQEARVYDSQDKFIKNIYDSSPQLFKAANQGEIAKTDVPDIIKKGVQAKPEMSTAEQAVINHYRSLTDPEQGAEALPRGEAIAEINNTIDFAKKFDNKQQLKEFYNKAQRELDNLESLDKRPLPLTDQTKEELSESIKEAVVKTQLRNQEYNRIKNKLIEEGPEAVSKYEMDLLSQGPKEQMTPEGVKQMTPGDEAAKKITEIYSGIEVNPAEEIPKALQKSKKGLINELGSEFNRFYGLDEGTKNALIQLEGGNDLRQEDLLKFFKEEFPISREDARQLMYHRENPGKYPISDELQEYADKVDKLLDVSRQLQESRGLQSEFFPESFIRKASKKIKEHEEAISSLQQESAIKQHKQAIEDLKDYQEFLKGLRYVPHRYLESEAIQKGALELMPEGRVSSKFRDTISQLKGRKIDTLDAAEEMGLIPETDIRVVLASHFEYLYRKVAIHDVVEQLKENKHILQPADEAPENWDRLAISQLSDYKAHPIFTKALEDFTYSYSTGIIGKGYDAVNRAGKMIVFHNPIILPFWNTFQGVAAGSVNPFRPFHTTNIHSKAFQDVTGKSELYRELVKRGVYNTPIENHYPNSMEQSMKSMIDRMDDNYPKWKKVVEKITGRPVSWKTYSLFPDAYKANWRLTWFLNRVQRTATVRHALSTGMNLDEAAEYANTMHANYNTLTRKSKKWLNRTFLVPTYKKAMIYDLPKYVAKNTIDLAKNIGKGQSPTTEQKQAFSAIWRLLVLGGSFLGFAAYKGYHFREGYRLVKRLKEPEVSKEGDVLTERVVTLPGPFAEIPKLAARLKRGPGGLYMYMAKVPQMFWGLMRNRRWMGEKYFEEGAAPQVQARQMLVGLLRDYIAPVDRIALMTDEESEAMDNILSQIGIATYKRGGTERKITWEILEEKKKLENYLKKPEVSMEDKKKAMEHYQNVVEDLIRELEDYTETYKLNQSDESSKE